MVSLGAISLPLLRQLQLRQLRRSRNYSGLGETAIKAAFQYLFMWILMGTTLLGLLSMVSLWFMLTRERRDRNGRGSHWIVLKPVKGKGRSLTQFIGGYGKHEVWVWWREGWRGSIEYVDGFLRGLDLEAEYRFSVFFFCFVSYLCYSLLPLL